MRSSSVAVEESVGSTAYKANSMESKKGTAREDYVDYLCTADLRRVIPPMPEVYLYVRSNAQGVQHGTLHETLTRNRQALVAQEILDFVSIKPFIIMLANHSCQQMPISKRVRVGACLKALTSRLESRDPLQRRSPQELSIA